MRERAFTASLLALVQAVAAVVLPVTEPLLSDALVLGAGELVPQAGRFWKGGDGDPKRVDKQHRS